ncbi:MAG: biotin--[Bacteroidaceae bacterium]|nr:biotin--[acetyl-CoA-carboxylase] ligase [Bacteroidaceae bacterium]
MTEVDGVRYMHRCEVTSTNTYAKELLAAGVDLPDVTVLTADFQTGGRGQRGNSWESERGQNLTFSLVCHPSRVAAHHQFVLSQAIAVAVSQTLTEYVDGISVKWPNDIYWHDRKLCGILIECNLVGSAVADCIIGVGLNVNQTVFVSDAPNPVSLAQIIGMTVNRDVLLQAVMSRFMSLYAVLRQGGAEALQAEYMRLLYRRTGLYRYRSRDGVEFMAETVGVEPTGHLVLRHADGEVRHYEFKEISFVI